MDIDAARVSNMQDGGADLNLEPVVNRLTGLAYDIHWAWRSFRHRPVFTATVIVLLSVGIAVTASTFAIVHAVAFRPLEQAA